MLLLPQALALGGSNGVDMQPWLVRQGHHPEGHNLYQWKNHLWYAVFLKQSRLCDKVCVDFFFGWLFVTFDLFYLFMYAESSSLLCVNFQVLSKGSSGFTWTWAQSKWTKLPLALKQNSNTFASAEALCVVATVNVLCSAQLDEAARWLLWQSVPSVLPSPAFKCCQWILKDRLCNQKLLRAGISLWILNPLPISQIAKSDMIWNKQLYVISQPCLFHYSLEAWLCSLFYLIFWQPVLSIFSSSRQTIWPRWLRKRK